MSDSKKNNDSSLSVNKSVASNHAINPESLHRFSNSRRKLSVDDYVKGIKNGNCTVLSQAITLIESTRPEHRKQAEQVIEQCLSPSRTSTRIAITGVPGVGKSTFIEAMGHCIIRKKKRQLAVLTIDPSSTRSKGSILGDKTRMGTLANNDKAFIRPSPTAGSLGGVARKTRETIYLCEAAGYDTILIETVGVGQSETAVHAMIDFFLLLMLPGAGDELQGIKRGIIEMADAIVINKTDSHAQKQVQQAMREYTNALHLYPPADSGWTPPVTHCSALKERGIEEIWSIMEDYFALTRQNGYFERNRKQQARHWMHETIQNQLQGQFYTHPAVKKELDKMERKVQGGEMSSFQAARHLLSLYDHHFE